MRCSAWPACSGPVGPRLARLLFGADRADSGTVTVEGEPVRLRNPRVALGKGIAYASENRRTEGLVGDLSVRANIVLAMQSARGWAWAIPRRQQAELADRYIKALDIRPPDPEAIVSNLSGGNQQKVLLARWLLTAPQAADPRRTDPGHRRRGQGRDPAVRRRPRGKGIAVLFISAELEEVLRLSHRIVILRTCQGRRDREPRHHRQGHHAASSRRATRRRGRAAREEPIASHDSCGRCRPRRPAGRHTSEVPVFFDIPCVDGNLYGAWSHPAPALRSCSSRWE